MTRGRAGRDRDPRGRTDALRYVPGLLAMLWILPARGARPAGGPGAPAPVVRAARVRSWWVLASTH
ncbi:hypothetical protein [Haliangium sp.]|uniref:hypothetical protein n=1 Tax=Haliangium sp. TaxID=2663208 RepID=UPI003D12EAEB